MTWRKLQNLVNRLPPESHTKTAARDELTDDELAELAEQPREGRGRWSHTDHLLAHLSDQLGWVMYAIFAAQGGKPAKPNPYPRPGVSGGGGRKLSDAGLAQLIEIAERNHADREAQIAKEPKPELKPDQGFFARMAARRKLRKGISDSD